ncbi:amidohydrolase family protein [Asticcacaulis biprosthecium C19]|uniref:Amidohydrolase family protein n=1 Tax=Asticcacaulis biprosthecium C19 TaxID=715226 RepID=F4QHC2_9CAUL|nr:amidohydrolase family protein [Asticcacaulis biprosthecium]EGF92659.1 amidohydrolase family protein [Asticcacaulis biprosthecium C19]
MTIERFVDAHIHLWQIRQLSHIRYPWLTPPFSDDGPNGSVEPIARDYLPADYRGDAAGFNVTKTVHIDAGAHPDDALAETRWLQDLPGGPDAIVAFAALNDLDVEGLLAAHVESPKVRGIRHILNWHPDPRLTYGPDNLFDDPQLAKGYALLAKYSLSFDLQIYPVQMLQAYEVAKNHPDIAVMINHMGMPVDDVEAWRAGMRKLAELPHVAVKISGLGFIDRNWTADSIASLILETIDIFTPARVMFASDFPTDKLFNGYARQLNTYDELTTKFSRQERDAMFAANAERLYRI